MRKDVEFKTQDGVTLAAWHYLPDRSSGKVPTIVMAHGFSAVKEMYLDKFAEVFAAAGLGALIFDTGTLVRAVASRARKSTPGSRSVITATRSRSPRHFRRPT
jgi:cephalosporin-C deacetylase-like acetyl esterase